MVEEKQKDKVGFFLGAPMWGYKEWVGSGRLFPPKTPAGEFLKIYSRKLTTVEGNTIFYYLPSEETVVRWREDTPSNFHFCPKVSREISHAENLMRMRAQTDIFLARMRLFGDRLGPIFLQLPPRFGATQLGDLAAFLDYWPTDLQLAVELRHPEFFQTPKMEAVNQLLREHDVARVIMDTRPMRVGDADEQAVMQARERKPNLPVSIALTGKFAFVRYIGHPRMEVNIPYLQQWAKVLARWYQEGITLYVFCHCPYEEHSPAICAQLHRFLEELIPLERFTLEQDELPPETGPQQMSLF